LRILYLTQVLPYPLDSGPKIRIYHMLRHLARHHQITLVSFVREKKEAAHVEHLRTWCAAVHTVLIKRSFVRDALAMARSLLSRKPFLIVRDDLSSMHAQVSQLYQDTAFDFVHADQLVMAQYALACRGAKKTLDEHNSVWTMMRRLSQAAQPGLRKFFMDLEWRKLQKYEIETCLQFDIVLGVTEEDKQAIQSLAPESNLQITVVPIGIDVDSLPRIERNVQAQNVVCVGGMFWPPNIDGVVWFGEEVFPLIKHKSPATLFFVIGGRPDSQIIELGARDSQIRVTGYVEDPTEYLRDSAVFIVPVRAAGGMRVKILDAWARGIPIVSTSIGCEGIEVRPGENILIADKQADFAEAVLRILRDAALARRLAENGRRWVEQKYDWHSLYQKLDSIYVPD
jgi:polysaccharide biosynthesis protein PslH